MGTYFHVANVQPAPTLTASYWLKKSPSQGLWASNDLCLEGTMDDDKDDKSIIEKTLEAVKDIAVVPSEATHEAMEPEPIKPGDEVVVMPMAATGLMGEAVMPLFVIIPRRTNAPKQIFKKTPKTAKKSAKKAAKKSAKKILKEKEGKSSSFQTIRSRRAFEFRAGLKNLNRTISGVSA
jgi:hypothetical protein